MESLATYKEKVNAELQRQFLNYRATIVDADELYTDLLKQIEEFILRGGKRLRPYMLYLAYKGFGGKDEEKIISIASSIELLHSFLLIHDDIIDRDTVRYGANNISGVYKDFFKECGEVESGRNADNIALLAGDMLHILSSKAVMNSSLSSESKNNILSLMYDTTLSVAQGEIVDTILSLGMEHIEASDERINKLYINKTASYSFELPLRIGFLLAQGSKENAYVDVIKKMSDALGIAYQLQDDLIGVFGDSNITGKTIVGDIREGKRTILYAKAITLLEGDDAKKFKLFYGNKNATDSEVDQIRSILEKKAIRQSIEDMCIAYNTKALLLLSELGFEPEAEEAFQNIIESFKLRTS